MDNNKPYSVNFDDIEEFLDNLFETDEKSKAIFEKCGISRSQLQIINTLIINALKAYDLQKQQ